MDAKRYTDERFGLPTVQDILRELEKPGRDPRPEFKTAAFQDGIEDLKDLTSGMLLEGVVTNVTNFLSGAIPVTSSLCFGVRMESVWFRQVWMERSGSGTLKKAFKCLATISDSVRTDTIAMDSQGRIFAGDDLGRIAIISEGKLHYHSAHQAGIKKVVYCEERQLLASLSYDRTLVLWHISETGAITERQRTIIPEIIWPRAAAILGNDKLVVGTFGTTYAIYNWQQDCWYIDGIEAGDGINAIAVSSRQYLHGWRCRHCFQER